MGVNSTAFDSILHVCQQQHRRIVLGVVAGEQRSLTLTELTEAVLKYSHQTAVPEASADVVREIRLSLHHIHLPKLATEGYINYDAERKLVEPIEQPAPVQSTLSTILDADHTLEAPIKL